MKVHKYHVASGVAALAVAGLFYSASGVSQLAFGRPPADAVGRDDGTMNVNIPRVGTGGPAAPCDFVLGYSTGFEATEVGVYPIVGPFALGAINNQPAAQPADLRWSKSTGNASVLQASVSNANPAPPGVPGVDQHFRLENDPALTCGAAMTTRTDGRILANVPAGTSPADLCPGIKGGIITWEFDYAYGGPNAAGSNYAADIRMIAQNFTGPIFRVWQLSFNSVNGHVLHSVGNQFTSQTFAESSPLKFFLDDGSYHHIKITYDMCSLYPTGVKTTYYEDGVEFASLIDPPGNTPEQVNQIIIISNNCAPSTFDIDNLSISQTACFQDCGDGIVQYGEGCEAGVADCNAGHVCDPVACTCDRICTLADPCILVNGDNGLFTPPFDALYGAIFLYDSQGQQSVAIDTCGTPGDETGVLFWGSAGPGVCSHDNSILCGFTANPDLECGMGECPDALIPCDDDFDCPGATELCVFPNTCDFDPGNANDDCCGDFVAQPWCVGSTENAPCFDFFDNEVTAFSACTCYDIPTIYDQLFLAQLRPTSAGVHVTVSKKTVCGGDIVGSCCDTNGAGSAICADNVLQADCLSPNTWSKSKCVDAGVCACIPICAGVTCGDDGCGNNCPDLCSDGNACDGLETCNYTSELCEPGTPVVCNDSNVCTDDSCVDPAGTCLFANNTADCTDNDGCTLLDKCADGACVPGTPKNCSNNNVCDGIETCSSPSGDCLPGTPLLNEDVLFCNGVETCDPALGWVDGPDPCDPTHEVCYEDKDDCFDTIIPTVSEWGLVVLTLLLLTGAKIYFSRRQAIA